MSTTSRWSSVAELAFLAQVGHKDVKLPPSHRCLVMAIGEILLPAYPGSTQVLDPMVAFISLCCFLACLHYTATDWACCYVFAKLHH